MAKLDVDELDEILQELANTVFRHGQAMRTNTPFHHGEPVKEAKQAITRLITEAKIQAYRSVPQIDVDLEKWLWQQIDQLESTLKETNNERTE